MKRVLTGILICVMLFTLTSCSSNAGIKRKSNIKQDEIRFLSLEWLTKKEDVEKAFDEKFGKETYVIEEDNAGTDINPPLYYYCDHYFGKGTNNYNPLNWEIGGYLTNQINVFYLSDDYKEKKMYQAIVFFSNSDKETYLQLRSKLEALYTIEETEDNGTSRRTSFIDKNGNKATLNNIYNSSLFSPTIQLTYKCGDMVEYIDEQRDIYSKKKNENKKQETRKENPDL